MLRVISSINPTITSVGRMAVISTSHSGLAGSGERASTVTCLLVRSVRRSSRANDGLIVRKRAAAAPVELSG